MMLQKGGILIKVSTITASIDASKKELYKEVDGEKFYRVPISMPEGDLDAVVSEYFIKMCTGTVQLSGYIRSDTLKKPKEHLYTYFNCMGVKQVDDNENVHEIFISGRLTKKGNLLCRKDGKQILPVVIRCKTADDGNTSIIHAVLFDKNARLVASYEDVREVSITASGKINMRYGTIEVHIDEAELFRKEDRHNA